MNPMYITFGLYLVAVLGIGLVAYFSTKNFDDYILGGRSLGAFVTAMSAGASDMSGWLLMGLPGAIYLSGFSEAWIAIGLTVGAYFNWLWVAGRLRVHTEYNNNALTLPDYFYHRFGGKSVAIKLSSAFIILFFFTIYCASGVVAGARLFQSLFPDMTYMQAMWLGAGATIAYTFIGGFRAVVLTDTIQGTVMIVGTLILLGGTLYALGGVENAMHKLTEIDPALVSPYGPDEMLGFQFMASFWVLVCFGVVGLPHTAVRCMAFKDSKALHRGMLIGTLVLSLIMFGMHLAGALGRAIIPDLKIADQVIPTLMLQVLPPIVAGIFLAAPMSAIMSTIDAQLIQSSSIFVKDLYLSAKPQAAKNEKKIGYISSVITLILTALLIIAALNPPDMIIWLNLFAFGGLEAAFLWVIVLGIYWDKANAYGALSSMLVGLGSYILLTQLGVKLLGFHQIVPALAFGLVAFLIGNRWGEKTTPKFL